MLRSALLFLAVIGLALLIALPLACRLLPDRTSPAAPPSDPSTSSTPVSSASLPPATESSEPDAPEGDAIPSSTLPSMTFSVYDEGTEELMTLSARDYVRGALASEMPPTFHPEALKAQAVACHTYAIRLALTERAAERKDPTLHGGDFSVDSVKREGYVTEETAKSRYGEADADRWWQTICQAADAVCDQLLVYEEEPIVAVYHAISPGRTERASAVWLTDLPYLLPVESEGDLGAPGYRSEVVLERAAVEAALRRLGAEDFADDPAGWLQITERSASGTVLAVQAAGISTDGQTLRTLFGLRSACFTVAYADGSFTFTCLGYGHGVGLSQYGAEGLAQAGKDYREILAHYYPGTTLVRTADA